MKFNGLDELIAKLERMDDEIEDDVDEIVKNNAIEFAADAKENGKKAFVKGYYTGNLVGLINVKKNGKMNYSVWSNAHYSGFLEYGTRYMNAEPYFLPTYQANKNNLHKDIKEILGI